MADYDCSLCKDYNTEVNCYHCEDGSKFKKINNFEKIRNMSMKEMAEFLENEKIRDEHSLCSDFGNGCYYSCKKNHACHDNIKQLYIEWLQSEAE